MDLGKALKEGKTVPLEFRISVYLKDLIGRELVTNKQAAILELVKNGFDAYAPTATVYFVGDAQGGPTEIVVADSGKGMNPEDIRNKWMFVGYSDKRELESVPPSWAPKTRPRRTMAGYKGIGRFSCDKLGAILNMYTRPDGGSWTHLQVDWGQFETDQKQEFQMIKAKVDGTKPDLPEAASLKHGTIVEISNLREQWDYQDVMKLRRWLERMRDPFNPRDPTFHVSIEAPMFGNRDENGKKREPASGPVENALSMELAQRTTLVSCKVENGLVSTSLLDKNRLVYKVIENASKYPFLSLAPTSIDIFYLNPKAKEYFTKKMGIEPFNYGSIMLYRNSFRVMPFGEPGDDWLGLERRRGQAFRRNLSSRELMGRISIEDNTTTFEEVSSRSGGIKNEEALAEVKGLVVNKLLRRLEKYVVGVIRWDSEKVRALTPEKRGVKLLEVVTSLAGTKKESKSVLQITPGRSAIDAIKEASQRNTNVIVDNLTALSKSDIGPVAQTSLKQNVTALRSALSEIKREIRAREEQLLFLEKTEARTGDMVTIMEHGFAIINNKALPSVEKLLREARGDKVSKSFIETLLGLKEALQILGRMSQMASTAKFELLKEDVVPVDVPSFVTQYLSKQSREALSSWGIGVHIQGDAPSGVKKTNVLALSVILDNLIDNSRKAGARNIYVKFRNKDNQVVVQFSDDGDGVSRKAIENLFQPGSSTRGGTGLGLYSIKRLAAMFGGKVEFVGNGVEGLGKGACFELMI